MNIQILIKRLVDIISSAIILILFIPFFILLAVLIKATSPGPIIFTQDRPGKNANIFKVYKLRTMKINSDNMVKGKEVFGDDNRITSVGRFLRRSKLDEVPQIFNVLRGEMSLVGPRPERVSSLNDYTDEISKRLNVLPGMTGLAQVSGNIYLSLEDRYKLDVYYAENFNLILDIKIILRTIGVIIWGEDKYTSVPLVKS